MNNKKHWYLKIHFIFKEVFQYSLVTYLILLLAETIQQGIISYFFDLNILLGIILVSGIVMLLTHDEKFDSLQEVHEKNNKIRKQDIFYIIFIAISGAFLVLYKTIDLGVLSIIISLSTAIIIILLSILILIDSNKEK